MLPIMDALLDYVQEKAENEKVETIVSYHGYAVKKETLSFERLHKLRKDLTVRPKANPKYPMPTSFVVYDEGKNWIRIPRAYGVEKFGNAKRNNLKSHTISVNFVGTIKEHQQDSYRKIVQGLRKYGSGICSLPTGFGKTVCILAVLAELQQRACILVHKTILLDQWVEEINRFLPSAKIGIIQGKRKEFSEDNDINIVMVQTLKNIQQVPPIHGIIIVDETHHLPAQSFSRILYKMNAKYTVGMSATVERADDLTKILYWHLGNILCSE